MAAGKLDRIIVIQQFTPAQDAIGGVGKTWVKLATVRANFRPLGGDEVHTSREEIALRNAVFRIRWRSDVDSTKTRIVYDGSDWDVEHIDETGGRRQRYLELTAKVIGN